MIDAGTNGPAANALSHAPGAMLPGVDDGIDGNPMPSGEPVSGPHPGDLPGLQWAYTDAMAGPRLLSALAARAARSAFARKGFGAGEVLTRWPAIVGPTVAQHTVPERLVFPPGQRTDGVLHVTVASGGFATELQHLEPLVLERINGFFGYRAVTRLRLYQRPLPAMPRRRERPAATPLSPGDRERLDNALSGTRDARLKAALEALGREILGRPPKAKG